jgi:hypothetical protein
LKNWFSTVSVSNHVPVLFIHENNGLSVCVLVLRKMRSNSAGMLGSDLRIAKGGGQLQTEHLAS